MTADIRAILGELSQGRMIVLIDDEERENEGDLLIAASHITAEAVNFMARHGRGLICLTLTESHCRQLGLPMMSKDNRSGFGTNFTVSIEAATGVNTGISAGDRAKTVMAAANPNAKPADLVSPGHIFPVQAEKGGVLVRAGHTEAGCDLTALAGLFPGRRHLRNHERRRQHGAPPRTGNLRRPTPAKNRHHRITHQTPHGKRASH